MEVRDLGEVVAGSTPRRSEPSYWGGDILWVSPGEVTESPGKFIQDTKDKLTPAGLDSCSTHLLPEGSILVTTRASIGAVKVAGTPICTNQGFKNLVPSNEADSGFYYHLLQCVSDEMERRASGTTFLEISKREFKAIRVPKPPLPEQRRIAHVLDTADAAIRRTEAIIAKLEQVKQGLLHDLLTRGLDEDGQLRPPPEKAPEAYAGTPLGVVPVDWTVQPLGEITEPYAGGTPNRSRPELYGGSVPWVKSAEVNAEMITKTEETLTLDGVSESSAKWVPAGTPLMAMYGATAGVVSWLAIEATTNQAVLALPPKVADTHDRWLFWALRDAAPRIAYVSQGSGQSNLSKRVISSSKLAVPPIEEQRQVAAFLDSTTSRIRAENAYLGKLNNLKAGIMQDLLTGRVRVPESIEVPV